MAHRVRVASLAGLAPGTGMLVPTDVTGLDDDVALLRDHDGSVHAIDDTCTHWLVSLARGRLRDGCVVCPAHAATYDLRTGAELTTTYLEPVRVHRVQVVDDVIFLVLGDDLGPGREAAPNPSV